MTLKPVRFLFIILFSVSTFTSFSQFRPKEIYWTADGNATLAIKDGNIEKTDVKSGEKTILVNSKQLIPAGAQQPLSFNIYTIPAAITGF
jgi:hypothetical protein